MASSFAQTVIFESRAFYSPCLFLTLPKAWWQNRERTLVDKARGMIYPTEVSQSRRWLSILRLMQDPVLLLSAVSQLRASSTGPIEV